MIIVKIKWTKIAVQDLECIFDFITEIEHKPDAARRMIKRIIDGVGQIKSFPECGRLGRVKGTRELVVVTTPFIIVYRINKNQLEILTVLHHARKWE